MFTCEKCNQFVCQQTVYTLTKKTFLKLSMRAWIKAKKTKKKKEQQNPKVKTWKIAFENEKMHITPSKLW